MLLFWYSGKPYSMWLLVHSATVIVLSQMATYWFVIGWFDNQGAQKSKARQAAKDVVKSKVYPQTYSP